MLLADYGETNKKYLTTDRLNASIEKDIEVFNNISNKKVKIELVRLVGKKKITMDINEVIEQDVNLTYIAIICGYKKLCDYVIQNGKIEEFKTFVSLNLKKFDFLGKYCIIISQYKELYEIS